VSALADYVNLTVSERTTYVRDMATEEPPLLGDVERMRPAVEGPLLISHAFRTPAAIEAALAAGADLVGMARALIADPDMPRKLLGGRAADIRPCVACNEDCRAFDPVLLCSVNPELGPPGADRRPAAPLVVRRTAESEGRVAIVGAGPAGLECAFALAGRREVVLFDERDAIGGQLAVAGAAPNRHGWRALLDFYAHALEGVELRLGSPVRAADDLIGFDEVVLAIGSTEQLPGVPGIERALASSSAIGQRLSGGSLLVVDDGFGWWPCASAVELGIHAGFETIMVATPGAAFGATLPPEGRVQLLARLRGAPLEVRPFTALDSLGEDTAVLRNTMSGATERVPADTVIVVGERVARDWSTLVPTAATVRVIGDALVPRKASHAIAEGRAAGESIARARPRAAAILGTV
jgi:2,4-dienoyl-CoA reductase (NADPH2)